MKKFLSLVLALIMTMSLVTVSAGAKDFTDDDKLNYEEAVAVMSEIGVIDGYPDGSFKPQNGLTRGAAAKIICNMILGPTTASALRADTAPFKDVAVDNQYAGYIAYCVQQGITAGYTDGTYRPAAPLTNFAFMKMLLVALGYDATTEGYVGGNCFINVAKQAIGIGLNAGLLEEFDGGKQINREEAALFAFNTLQATMVEYDQKTVVTVGNAEVALSGNLKDVQWTGTKNADGNIKDDGKVQFAEKYFTKLAVKADTDAFERPCHTWVIGKETVGTYVDYTKLIAEYTESVTGKELYDIVGTAAFKNFDFYAYLNGEADDFTDEIAKNNADDISVSGNGVLLQVFVDNDEEEVTVTAIRTYLAQATADYNAKKETVSLNVFDKVRNDGTQVTGVKPASSEDFDVADLKADDFVLITYAADAIQSVEPVEIIADTAIDAFKSGKGGSLTVDGTKYSYNVTAAYKDDVLAQYTEAGVATNLKDLTYNIYVDQYGYAIGVDLVKAPDNYVFITGADSASSNLVTKTWTANAIFMDGTSEVIDVKNNGVLDDEAVINKWYSYTVSNSGVYTLTDVAERAITSGTDKTAVSQHRSGTNQVGEINAKHITLQGAGSDSRIYGNDATVYLLADLDKVTVDGDDNAIITGVDEIVTGVRNAAFTTWNARKAAEAVKAENQTVDATTMSCGVYALYKANGYVIAAVVVGESDTVASDLAYVISGGVSSESYDKSTKTWTWTRDVVIGGEKVTLKEVNDTGVSVLKNDLPEGDWVTVKYDVNGNVKKVEAADVETTIGDAVDAIENGSDDVVVLDNGTATSVYSLKGSTLYDETSDKLGFLVADDVKIVLTQTNKNKKTTTYESGIKTLEGILIGLNEKEDESHEYVLDAVVEKGIATTIIIVDKVKDNEYVGPGGSTGGIQVTVANGAIAVEANDADTDAVAAAIVAKLNTLGYKDVKVTVTDGDISGVVGTKNSIEYNFGAPTIN